MVRKRNKATDYFYVRMIMFDGARPIACKRNKAYVWCSWKDIKQFTDKESAIELARKKSECSNVASAEVRYMGAEKSELIKSIDNPNYDYFKMLADMKAKALRRKYCID